jgi:hypothetical protein
MRTVTRLGLLALAVALAGSMPARASTKEDGLIALTLRSSVETAVSDITTAMPVVTKVTVAFKTDSLFETSDASFIATSPEVLPVFASRSNSKGVLVERDYLTADKVLERTGRILIVDPIRGGSRRDVCPLMSGGLTHPV